MRWVKAKKELPKNAGDYHTKVNFSTHLEKSLTDFNGEEFDNPNVVEWLDEQPLQEQDDEAIIDFAVWYSGMERMKVINAYNRYLTETSKK